ncbi:MULTISPECIES: TetR/AcrR family transcriptional regulator [Sporosarcina]|uniref:TetR/AcrR family transcriptional regulator n=1 Tax=Sporosarcina TaxID=1569 RepID=UPI000590DE38|nr:MULTISPECIES: TetR/AcrR family transcriptional regulator [Sporosarcina]WJY28397.1 helix-turn-helix domain-containing protein [Sporosarcina sp. 0.2-SM1T-5]
MTEKKEMIIKKAAELFAKNGYDATSIQQITDACGISKGSFYLSFKSKESLLGGIITYFSEKIVNRIEGVFIGESTSASRFEHSLSIYFEELDDYSSFILTLIREQANPMNESMRDQMESMRKKMYLTQEKLLIDLYGEEYRDRMPDLITMLNGIIKGYIELIVISNGTLDHKNLPAFIRNTMDAIASAVETPFLTRDQLIEFQFTEGPAEMTAEELVAALEEVMKDPDAPEEEIVSAEMIRTELMTGKPRRAVLSGMATNLTKSRSAKQAAEGLSVWLSGE